MHIIVCVDDNGGMLFNKRRQSKDSVLRARVLSGLNGRNFRMNSYSFGQFSEDEGANEIFTDENFLDIASDGDVCFVENVELLPYSEKIETITLYKWNRTYPSSVKFPKELLAGRKLIASDEFVGSSHEKITEETYR